MHYHIIEGEQIAPHVRLGHYFSEHGENFCWDEHFVYLCNEPNSTYGFITESFDGGIIHPLCASVGRNQQIDEMELLHTIKAIFHDESTARIGVLNGILTWSGIKAAFFKHHIDNNDDAVREFIYKALYTSLSILAQSGRTNLYLVFSRCDIYEPICANTGAKTNIKEILALAAEDVACDIGCSFNLDVCAQLEPPKGATSDRLMVDGRSNRPQTSIPALVSSPPLPVHDFFDTIFTVKKSCAFAES